MPEVIMCRHSSEKLRAPIVGDENIICPAEKITMMLQMEKY
jgi:hypothetical protein